MLINLNHFKFHIKIHITFKNYFKRKNYQLTSIIMDNQVLIKKKDIIEVDS